MRYMENRRDGWGEWGAAPGPGTHTSTDAGAPAGEAPEAGPTPAPAQVGGARMPDGDAPGLAAGVSGGLPHEGARAEAAGVAGGLPYDGDRAEGAGVAGTGDAADGAGAPLAEAPPEVAPSGLDTYPAVDVSAGLDTYPAVDVPVDLGPAMDAVAGVGRSAKPGAEMPTGLAPVLDAAPASGMRAVGQSSVEEPVDLGPVGEAAPGAGPEIPVSGEPTDGEPTEVEPTAVEAADTDADADAEPVVRAEPSEAVDMVPAQAQAQGVGADVPAPANAADRRAADEAAAAAHGARAERAPSAVTTGAGDPAPRWGAGRRRTLAGETTAPLPGHLLLRDTPSSGGGRSIPPADAAAGRPGVRRPPLPRSPRTQNPTRPAPVADPRLTERPGPVLPGWAALLAGAAGTAAGAAVLAWHGALPAAVTGRLGIGVRPYHGLGIGTWAVLALLLTVVLLALGGLGRGRVGYASVLTLFGDYRGSVRRTGLVWSSPLLLRRRVDVRLRHWRSEPLPAVDASGTPLRAVVLVVWRVQDTARATLGVADHEQYLRDQVEAALARVLSQLPADAFHEDTRTLRDAEAVGGALTRMLKGDCSPVGIEVYSAQPTAIEYAPEVAASMHRRRVAALDARHRDSVLTSVVDAVDDTVGRLTARGIVELDDYEHKALVRDLTVAFYAGRSGGPGV